MAAGGFDARVEGGQQLAALAAALRTAGRVDLLREMQRGLRKATAPARQKVADSARSTLPHGGGLNEVVAARNFTSRTSTAPRTASVRIVAVGLKDSGRLARGLVRHPLFGNRGHWYTQHVDADWFTRPLEELAPEIQREMQAVMDRIITKLVDS